jgi:hypothetical protein
LHVEEDLTGQSTHSFKRKRLLLKLIKQIGSFSLCGAKVSAGAFACLQTSSF